MGDSNGTIYLTTLGDITIEVLRERKDDESSDTTQDIVCSSHVLCLASPVWRAMFENKDRFLEGNTGKAHFHDDNPEALLIILRIAHLQYQDLPSELQFRGLVNLAVICDKYETTKIVRPWLARWEKPWTFFGTTSGHEELLFISWTFGNDEIFTKVLSHLIRNCVPRNAGVYLPSGKLMEGHYPPGIIGSTPALERCLVIDTNFWPLVIRIC